MVELGPHRGPRVLPAPTGPLSVNGEVATATLGFDSQWDRWIGGVALSYSEGEGAYTHRSAAGGGGEQFADEPDAVRQFTRSNDRTSVWGTLGYGVGDLTLTPEGASAGIETDLSTALAAFGGRGVLNARVAGIRLAWVSDAPADRDVLGHGAESERGPPAARAGCG